VRLIASLVLMFGAQLVVYALVVRPRILTWGATRAEAAMPMPGDGDAPWISCTRAVTINASVADVWQWVIQLGADRGGFFSYTLLEKAMGYGHTGTEVHPEHNDFEVGRLIPASVPGASKLIDYNFRVVEMTPQTSFVLENWGAFVLQEQTPERTRLLVRTHGKPLTGPGSRLTALIGEPLHYLMERRMLLGFKERAEAGPGVQLTSTPDNLWLAGMLLSGLGLIPVALFSGGTAGAVVAVLVGLGWLLTLFFLPPRPTPALILLAVVAVAIALPLVGHVNAIAT
jgi:hypothetical protein